MALKTIKSILMERDGISSVLANTLIAKAKTDAEKRIKSGDILNMDSDICREYFGLGSNYFWEIMPLC